MVVPDDKYKVHVTSSRRELEIVRVSVFDASEVSARINNTREIVTARLEVLGLLK